MLIRGPETEALPATEQWLTRHRIGEHVDPDAVDWIDDIARYDLPPLSGGCRYATVDGTLVVLDPESYEIFHLFDPPRLFSSSASGACLRKASLFA